MNKEQLKRWAFEGSWESAQAFRWMTRAMTRKQVADLLGITLYRVDKVQNTRACHSCRATVIRTAHCAEHMPAAGTAAYQAFYV